MELIGKIEELLQNLESSSNYADYVLRTRLFSYWMQIAKELNYGLNKGLDYAEQWRNMENERNAKSVNLEPYYYYRTLHCLRALKGYKDSLRKVHDINQEIADLQERVILSRSALEKLRDIWVEGDGMGQLFDIRNCRSRGDKISDAVSQQSKRPCTVEGRLKEVVRTDYATLEIDKPPAWQGEKAHTGLDRAASIRVTEAQNEHHFSFQICFSVDYIRGLCNERMIDLDSTPLPFTTLQNSGKAEVPESKDAPAIKTTKPDMALPSIPKGHSTTLENLQFHENEIRGEFEYEGKKLRARISFSKRNQIKRYKQQQALRIAIEGSVKDGIYLATLLKKR